MITNCPVCGKEFDVLYPDLWRYKRGKFLCSYRCMRAIDKGEQIPMRLTDEQKRKALELAMGGTSPMKFIEECGVKNPGTAWFQIKKNLQKNKPEIYAALPEKFKPAAKSEPEGKPVERQKPPYYGQPIPGFGDEPEKVDVVPETPFRFIATTMEYKTTGISTPIGDWQYFKRSGYLDWTPLDGNGAVSMNLEEWKELMKLFPEVLKVLGVEL